MWEAMLGVLAGVRHIRSAFRQGAATSHSVETSIQDPVLRRAACVRVKRELAPVVAQGTLRTDPIVIYNLHDQQVIPIGIGINGARQSPFSAALGLGPQRAQRTIGVDIRAILRK